MSVDKILNPDEYQKKLRANSAHCGRETSRVVEDNHRASVKLSAFHEAKKPFYNCNKSVKPEKDFSKPDYMSLPERPKNQSNRLVVSQFTGWLTVDEKNGIIRKRAPETEMGQQKLPEDKKLINRPSWMLDHHIRYQQTAEQQAEIRK